MSSWKKGLLIAGFALSIALTVAGAFPLRDAMSVSQFLSIFAGGVLFGVSLVSLVRSFGRREPSPAPPPPSPVPKSGA
jgi:hypothetical protein